MPKIEMYIPPESQEVFKMWLAEVLKSNVVPGLELLGFEATESEFKINESDLTKYEHSKKLAYQLIEEMRNLNPFEHPHIFDGLRELILDACGMYHKKIDVSSLSDDILNKIFKLLLSSFKTLLELPPNTIRKGQEKKLVFKSHQMSPIAIVFVIRYYGLTGNEPASHSAIARETLTTNSSIHYYEFTALRRVYPLILKTYFS